MRPVIGFDLASLTGWALRDRRGTVTSGVQSFELTRWESHGMRALRARKFFREILDLAAEDPLEEPGLVVAFERPVQYGHGGKRATGAAVTYQLVGVLLAEVEGRGLTNVAPTPAEVKKSATGKGNAGKPLMVSAARERWDKPDLESEDEADALCVLGWAIDEIGEDS